MVDLAPASRHALTLIGDQTQTGFYLKCHGSTGSPLALMRRVLGGGVTVLEGAGVLARGTGSCT